MTQHNPVNERIKRQYFTYLKEAKRYSAPSIDAAAAAIASFEAHTRCLDFKRFRIEQAVAFKRNLGSRASAASGAPLSKATQRRTLTALRSFFIWLADKPGYQSRIRYTDADYFNLSEKDSRIATASRPKAFPSFEQVHATIAAMPAQSVIDKRDRALIALTLLTGCRDGALASIKVKHVDLGANCLLLDAREVKTKFSKTFVTYFFPVGGDARQILADWMETLRSDLLWAPTDPLFPKTRMEAARGEGFRATGLERAHWSNASPIRRIFREAFERAGLPPFNPHSIRDTLIQLGQRVCHGPEEFKAWSQNIGHESVMTTFTSYGQVSPARQAQIIEELGKDRNRPDDLQRLLLRAAAGLGRSSPSSALAEENTHGSESVILGIGRCLHFHRLGRMAIVATSDDLPRPDGMIFIAAREAKYGFGRLIDLARAEPVTVAKHGRPFVVVMAVEEFERLKALEKRAAKTMQTVAANAEAPR